MWCKDGERRSDYLVRRLSNSLMSRHAAECLAARSVGNSQPVPLHACSRLDVQGHLGSMLLPMNGAAITRPSSTAALQHLQRQ